MKTGKATDQFGISAEHFKYGGEKTAKILTNLINEAFKFKRVPQCFKEGIVSPLFKGHGKPICLAKSYRRITVSPVMGKLMESVHLCLEEPKLLKVQSRLQRGFTAGVNPTFAALPLTEAIIEAKELGQTLFTTFVDASSAFDVVWHASLLKSIFKSGISGQSWQILNDWYTNMSSAVRWEGKLSTSFAELQGVRQGSVWSPSVYKLFVNPLIKKLESESLGFKIGNVFVGTPMCADDLLLISSKPDELQTMISYTSHFAETEEYNISKEKTKVMIWNSSLNCNLWNQMEKFHIGSETLETVENYKHIGIDRDSREVEATRTIIGNRLKTARQTSYALMGSGLHGLNGLNPEVSCKLWSTYVVPRLLFGLEIVNLSAKDISRLDIFCQLPIIALLHKKILITFGTIARSDSVENDLAKRQLSTKGKNSKSWFIRADKILKQYNLPCASEVLLKPETKYKWKMKVKKCVDNFWSEKLFTEAKSKPSLRYLNIKNCKIGVVNSIWKSAGSEQMCIRKACYKIKMLLDTYILQYHRSKFSNGQKTSICPLCEEGTEHLEHFLVVCSALTSIRDIFISKLYTVVVPKIGTVAWTDICVSNSKMIQLILDCSRFEWYHVLEKNDINLVESITRSLCYSLHEKRSVLLESK
ncbi:unnamed protein product [Mytilus edulis]|uniref:Reverse transcriptase domain-containing protein n=1 Tax=Mytilus edulis TaxID=6550 RepID=A0A8S3QZC2_MYTED|nr:unnamed protein product [Mytilus edulis]